MRPRAALLIAAVLIPGCSQREHSNPFDPANPDTRGRPPGFEALAGSSTVDLRWRLPGAESDVAFQVWRRVAGEADYRPVSVVLPGTVTSYSDFGLVEGVRVDYRLYYVFSGSPGGIPAEDYATPSPRRPYVTELDRPSVDRLTADGRHVRDAATDVFGPTFLAFDRSRATLWASDTFDGSVRAYSTTLALRGSIVGLTEPASLALDSLRGDLWVCDQARSAVYHYDTDGAPRDPVEIDNLELPSGIALDAADGSIWVCERTGNRVRRFLRSGTPSGVVAVDAPSRIAVDSTTRDAWVTSFDARRLVHVLYSGAVDDTLPLQGPIGVAVDWRRGRIWVADARAGEVVALRRSGLIEFKVGGLSSVGEVAVDLASGECWAAARGINAVVRITPTGSLAGTIGGLSNPYHLVVDSGP